MEKKNESKELDKAILEIKKLETEKNKKFKEKADADLAYIKANEKLRMKSKQQETLTSSEKVS